MALESGSIFRVCMARLNGLVKKWNVEAEMAEMLSSG
jgi:hypothetical protein